MDMDRGALVPTGAPSELGVLWEDALRKYTDIIGDPTILATTRNISIGEVIADISAKEELFAHKRHDGSALARLRRVLGESLLPLQALAKIVTQASKAVRYTLPVCLFTRS